MDKKKKIILGVACLVLAGFIALCIYFGASETEIGIKNIKLTVKSGTFEETLTITTEEKYLGAALKAKGLIVGEEQSQGFFVTSVKSIPADPENGFYWMFYQDGELLQTGVDEHPIHNGDSYSAICEQYAF